VHVARLLPFRIALHLELEMGSRIHRPASGAPDGNDPVLRTRDPGAERDGLAVEREVAQVQQEVGDQVILECEIPNPT
jgi:hypothetical protein